jgi:hypothetical protein
LVHSKFDAIHHSFGDSRLLRLKTLQLLVGELHLNSTALPWV